MALPSSSTAPRCRQRQGHFPGVVARPFFLFVAALLLLVEDDKAQVFKRREHGAPHADQNPRRATARPVPHIPPLVLGQLAVGHSDSVTEPSLKTLDNLCRQGDFRYQDEDLPVLPHCFVRSAQVDFRLAAARNPPEQIFLRRALVQGCADCVDGLLLFRRQPQGLFPFPRPIVTVAQDSLFRFFRPAQPGQGPQHFRVDAAGFGFLDRHRLRRLFPQESQGLVAALEPRLPGRVCQSRLPGFRQDIGQDGPRLQPFFQGFGHDFASFVDPAAAQAALAGNEEAHGLGFRTHVITR